jgi:hypothetical protein
MTRAGIGKPILLITLLCAFLLPLSKPVVSGAMTEAAMPLRVEYGSGSISAALIQRQIVHIATHPRAGVPFLMAFLTEAERLCQPRAHELPSIPSPNAAASLLSDASSIAMPISQALPWAALFALIGRAAPLLVHGSTAPPEPPPPRNGRL